MEKNLETTEIFELLDNFTPKPNPILLSLYPLPIVLKENEVGWCCDMCNKILKYKSKFYHHPTLDDSVDYCPECFEEIEGRDRDYYEFIDTENMDLYSINTRQISIASLARVPERKLDPRITLSEKGTQEWLDLIPKIDYIPMNFGSLRNWAAISLLHDIPFMPIDIILLVDTVKNRIAIGVVNKEGYLSLHIVYDDIDSYLVANQDWENNKASEDVRRKSLKTIREDLKDQTCSSSDLLNLITDFGASLAVTNKFTRNIIKNYITFKK